MWKEMSLFRRVMVLLMAALILLFGVLTLRTVGKKGIEYGGSFLYCAQEGDAVRYTGEVNGQPAQFTVKGDTVTYQWGDDEIYGPYRVDTDPNQKISEAIDGHYPPLTVFLEGEVIFRGGYSGDYLLDENGEVLWGSSVNSYVSNGQTYVNGRPLTLREQNEPDLHAVLRMAMGPELTHRASFGFYLVATLMAVVNILLILFPDFFFRWSFRYRVRNYADMEPSNLALAMRPVSWILLGLVTLALYCWNLTIIF